MLQASVSVSLSEGQRNGEVWEAHLSHPRPGHCQGAAQRGGGMAFPPTHRHHRRGGVCVPTWDMGLIWRL